MILFSLMTTFGMSLFNMLLIKKRKVSSTSIHAKSHRYNYVSYHAPESDVNNADFLLTVYLPEVMQLTTKCLRQEAVSRDVR